MQPLRNARSRSIQTLPGRFWFEVGLIFLVFFVAAGDPAPALNEAHYLCRLKHYWHAGPYCPGDLFLESPDAHFTVVWLLGWVTWFVSLEATAWLGRIVSWALVAIGWRRLLGQLTETPLLAPLAAAGLVAGSRELHFAGEWIIGGFEAKTLAYGFVFLSLADAMAGRWNRAWLGLGFASALHALVGAWSVAALLGILPYVSGRPPVRRMWPGLTGGAMLAMGGVIPALLLNRGVAEEVVSQANEIYVYLRLPHHLALLTMPGHWLADRAIRHAALVAGLAVLTALRWRAGGDRLRLLLLFAWASEAFSLAGLAISLVGWEDRAWAGSLLRYYWHRLADIAAPTAVAAALAEWVGAGMVKKKSVAALALVGSFALATGYLGQLALSRARSPVAAGDAVMADPQAWVAMCEWIRENTPADAVFFVPRRSHTFKWRTERAEVVSYKDIPQNAEGLIEWRRRLEAVFHRGTKPDGRPISTPSLAKRGSAYLRELASRFGADFALDQAPRGDLDMPSRHRASLPVAHREGPYTLYDLRGGP